jgi:hypothetical protein
MIDPDDEDIMIDQVDAHSYGMGNDYDLKPDYGFMQRLDRSQELFQLKKIYEITDRRNDKFRKVATADEGVVMITDTNKVWKWDFENEIKEIIMPETRDDSLGVMGLNINLNPMGMIKNALVNDKKLNIRYDKVFLDHKGTHCIITTNKDFVYYIHKSFNKAKILKLKEKVLCVLFDELSITDNSCKILYATAEGKLGSVALSVSGDNLNEKDPKLLIDRVNGPIRFLEMVNVNETVMKKSTKFWLILVVTESWIYKFKIPPEFERLDKFAVDIKGAVCHDAGSKINYFTTYSTKNQVGEDVGHSMIFGMGSTIRYVRFPEVFNENELMKDIKTLKMIKRQDGHTGTDLPIAITCSEHHYYILHKDCLTIASLITETVVTAMDELSDVNGLFSEQGRYLYIYNPTCIKQMDLAHEGHDVWKLYLDKKRIKDAYENCVKNKSPYLEYVTGLYADELFANKRYLDAARLYCYTSRAFEEIALKFINNNCENGLFYYLENVLKPLRSDRPEEKVKVILIKSWMLEYYLNQINENDRIMKTTIDKEETSRAMAKKDEFMKQINTIVGDLDDSITYSLLQSHGRFKEFVEHARRKNNPEIVIMSLINEEKFAPALEEINSLKTEVKKDLLYRYCHIFMRHETVKTLKSLRSLEKFDPTKLIAGLMNIPNELRATAIDFLTYCTEKLECREKSIHNILIFFLSSLRNEKQLYDYLGQQEEFFKANEQVYFDMDFALRNFKQNGLVKAQIMIYGMMGLYSEAVKLALDNRMIQEAKDYANKPDENNSDSEDLKKKLWLEIAKYMLRAHESVDSVIKLTKESANVLKIEDLLPFFNENITIESFKDEISASLKSYVDEINKLKTEMAGFEKNSEYLKNELRNIKNRFLEVRGDQKCEECAKSIFLEEFYVFSCSHTYHKDCLKRKHKALGLEPAKFQRIEEYEKKLGKLQAEAASIRDMARKQQGSAMLTVMNAFVGKKDTQIDRTVQYMNTDLEKQIRETRDQLDSLLAAECLTCGRYLIDMITMPFDVDKKVKDEWEV